MFTAEICLGMEDVMKRILGKILMLLGVALMLGAMLHWLHNGAEQASAARSAARALEQVQAAAGEIPAAERKAPGMREVEIDGYGYIGWISIPVLDLNLPVMSGWDEERLRIAPCRYCGTVAEDNLVLAGHNYVRHFGPIRRLQPGDAVTFTDMEGLRTDYEVAAVEILPGNAVAEMTAGMYDLTLFTCTYGGESRITVYCRRVFP